MIKRNNDGDFTSWDIEKASYSNEDEELKAQIKIKSNYMLDSRINYLVLQFVKNIEKLF